MKLTLLFLLLAGSLSAYPPATPTPAPVSVQTFQVTSAWQSVFLTGTAKSLWYQIELSDCMNPVIFLMDDAKRPSKENRSEFQKMGGKQSCQIDNASVIWPNGCLFWFKSKKNTGKLSISSYSKSPGVKCVFKP